MTRPRSSALIVLVALAFLTAPLAVEGQPAGKVWRIGCLWGPAPVTAHMEAFRGGLRELGYVEGRDVVIEWRFAEGRHDRLLGMAVELVRLKVDVIVTLSPSAALAAKNATSEIPVVFIAVSDPIVLGLVRTLARPGGNITGFTNFVIDLTGKRLQLLKEAIPSLKSVALLTDPVSPGSAAELQEARIAARKLELTVRVVEAGFPSELKPAITTIANDRAGAMVIVGSPFLYTHRAEIADLAARARLPAR